MAASSYLSNAGEFLISVIFDLYILAVMLRFLLQWVRADFYNPFSQFLVKVTNPALRPLRRIIPGYAGIDWPSILLMLILQAVELVLISLLKIGIVPAVTGLVVLSIAQLLQLAVWIYIVLILVQVILSWVNPHAYSPVTVLMYQLTDPIMRPVRRMIPPAGGFDWSPLVVIIALNLILILVIAPLGDLGQSLSYRALSYPAPVLH